MQADFTQALHDVIVNRAGVRTLPDGSQSSFGISQDLYTAYRLRNKKTIAPVANIEPSEVSDLYRTFFWGPALGDDATAPLAQFLFDTAIDWGAPQAIKLLQREIGLTPDGEANPATRRALIALNNWKPDRILEVVSKLLTRRFTITKDRAIDSPADALLFPERAQRIRDLAKRLKIPFRF